MLMFGPEIHFYPILGIIVVFYVFIEPITTYSKSKKVMRKVTAKVLRKLQQYPCTAILSHIQNYSLFLIFKAVFFLILPYKANF